MGNCDDVPDPTENQASNLQCTISDAGDYDCFTNCEEGFGYFCWNNPLEYSVVCSSQDPAATCPELGPDDTATCPPPTSLFVCLRDGQASFGCA